MDLVVFWIVAPVSVGAAVLMLLQRNAVHAALLLIVNQFTLAVFFVLLGAHLLAAVQVIVYAGAIMVLFLFVIMLLGVDRKDALVEPLPGQRPLALGLGALLAAEILYVAWKGVTFVEGGTQRGAEALTQLNRDPGNVRVIADALFSRYLLPFEVTSVLLVVAVVGVMVLARRIATLPSSAPQQAVQATPEDVHA